MADSSASTVTVAGWPTWTWTISDSLSATTSCIELRSLRTAKEEPELPVPVLAVEEAPAPPVAVAPVPPAAELELDELEEVLALLVPEAETDSPTSPERVTRVPVLGA